MIDIKRESKIYLMCPPAYASGGPELLHQLSNKLNGLGVNSLMFYSPMTNLDPVHSNYLHYQTKFATNIEDTDDNIIIIPEVMISIANKSLEMRRIRKFIWWLSVDNFFKPLTSRQPLRKLTSFLGLSNALNNLYFSLKITFKNYAGHLVQSQYAATFLRNKGISSLYLSDYLSMKFINRMHEMRSDLKRDIVLYNPKKGMQFTELLISAAPEINWVPLVNLNQNQVADLLLSAKVYIDFGEHPGKDRFPREAAILGCCIIVGLKGSASFYEDVSIPEMYKVEDSTTNLQKIIGLVKSCMNNYGTHAEDFESYKKKIQTEEDEFGNAVKAIFRIL